MKIKKLGTTATTTDLGNWLIGKLVLYLGCFTSSIRYRSGGKSEEWA
jgi:hypothetical protein